MSVPQVTDFAAQTDRTDIPDSRTALEGYGGVMRARAVCAPASVRSSVCVRLPSLPPTLGLEMTFIEREKTETLAEHLLRNADHLGLSEAHRSQLQAAFRLEQGPFKDRVAKREALGLAADMASKVQADMAGAATDALARAAAAELAALRVEHQALLLKRVKTPEEGRALKALARKIQTATTLAKPGEERTVSPAFIKAQAVGVAQDVVTGIGVVRTVVTRIKARDGLASLVDAKAITEAEAKVGLAYRLLFEQCGPGSGLGSQLEDRPRSIRASTHGVVAHGLLKAYAGVRLTGVERAVQHADASGRALAVLRAVAGAGHTIRSLGAGGNTNRANLAALQVALRITRAALEGNGGLRIGER